MKRNIQNCLSHVPSLRFFLHKIVPCRIGLLIFSLIRLFVFWMFSWVQVFLCRCKMFLVRFVRYLLFWLTSPYEYFPNHIVPLRCFLFRVTLFWIVPFSMFRNQFFLYRIVLSDISLFGASASHMSDSEVSGSDLFAKRPSNVQSLAYGPWGPLNSNNNYKLGETVWHTAF